MTNRKITAIVGAMLLGLVLGCDGGNEAIEPTQTVPPPQGNPGGSISTGDTDHNAHGGQMTFPRRAGN